MLLMAKARGRPRKRNTPLDKSGKTGITLSVRIDEDINAALLDYCKEPPRRVKNDVVMWALQKFLESVGFYPRKQRPIDDFDANTKRES